MFKLPNSVGISCAQAVYCMGDGLRTTSYLPTAPSRLHHFCTHVGAVIHWFVHYFFEQFCTVFSGFNRSKSSFIPTIHKAYSYNYYFNI